MQFCPRIYWYCYREKREKKKKKVTWYLLDIVFSGAPLWFFMLIYIFLLLLSNVWGQYHTRRRPDTVRWLKFICILQRSGAAARCFASWVPLPEEVQGSGKHEHPTAPPTTQPFSPWKLLNLIRVPPPPAAAALLPGLSHAAVNPYELTENQVKRLWT